MAKTSKNIQEINKIVTTFSVEKQEEVLNFVKFLQGELDKKQLSKTEQKNEIKDSQQSALELAGDLVSCLDGPEDLSTNKKYFQEFGK